MVGSLPADDIVGKVVNVAVTVVFVTGEVSVALELQLEWTGHRCDVSGTVVSLEIESVHLSVFDISK